MTFYFAGFHNTSLFGSKEDAETAVDSFTKVDIPGLTEFEIGWSYFLLWKGDLLYFTNYNREKGIQPLEIPGRFEKYKIAAAGKDCVVILTTNNDIWQYKILENSWKKVPNFITNYDGTLNEYPVKIIEHGCTTVLTNLGRVFVVPMLVKVPNRTKFVDIARGFDHTILLTDTGIVYSMGIGLRGQLGHDDLEDFDEPQMIKALAGMKVVEIAAGGWHSAAVTDQGDLYTWGWNTQGELGLENDCQVVPTPTLVEFKDEKGRNVDLFVHKVECGNNFTICLADNHSAVPNELWGCGSNKFGQLGKSRVNFPKFSTFVKLDIPLKKGIVNDFKCNEWGTVLLLG